MGGRQSQEATPAPVDVTPPAVHSQSVSRAHHTHRTSPSPPAPSHRHHRPSSHHHVSPSHLPTLSDYPHLQSAARLQAHRPASGHRPQQHHHSLDVGRPATQSPADQLVELNIALSTLQRRLQARAEARERATLQSASLPSGLPLLFFRPVSTLQCPVCSKDILSSEMEAHMAQCISRPRVTYNADTLEQSSGECSICLEDMLPGEEIARLPCLCIYHLKCAQMWFKVSQTCPEHPDLT